MKKIKVLQILVCLGGGGIETLLLNLQKLLPEHITFDYLVVHPAYRDSEAVAAGSTVHVLPDTVQHPTKWATYIGQLVKEHHYDVVHFQRFAFGGNVLCAAKKAGAVVRICHSHHTLLQESSFFKKLIYYPYHWTINRLLLYKNATHIIGCSSDSLRFLMGSFWQYAKCRVILNGIPVNTFAEKMGQTPKSVLRRKYGISPDSGVIGNFGRLDPVKNHQFLLQIFDVLAKRKSTSNTAVFIGGEGPLRKELEQKREQLRLNDQIFLPGQCSNAAELLGNLFDCFVLPSKAEGLPISIIEAVAAGLYVVCSDSITKDITDAFSDRITALPLSAPLERWADAVESAIQRRIPPAEGLELVKNSPMNFDCMANEIIKIYDTAASVSH